MRILLSNWTLREDCAGGVETVFGYLKQAFPHAELISGSLYSKEAKDCVDLVRRMDEHILREYKKDQNILLIRDAEFGGVLDITQIPQITLFQNPYKTINEKLVKINHPWVTKDYLKNLKPLKKIATTNFMANEMASNGLTPDHIIPNCIDIDLFKPMDKKKLREQYDIPKNKRIAVWVGMPNVIKNFQMMLDLMEADKEVFWLLITKMNFPRPCSNSKVFFNQDSKSVADLLNCADFFILTSPIEGCGMAMLEAMACNLPCILTRTGYFWDFWDDKIGIPVEWHNFEQHVNAIKRINQIKTDSRKVLIKEKLTYSTWKTNWERIIEEVENEK